MDSSILEKVRELRGQGRSPKQIARALGMAPAAVAPYVRAVAEQADTDVKEPELAGCWINVGWSEGLGVPGRDGWADEVDDGQPTGGTVSVVVARRHGWDKLSVCGYLVDVYCLGVKNVMGPDVMNEVELRSFLAKFFRIYPAAGGRRRSTWSGTWSSARSTTRAISVSNRRRTSPRQRATSARGRRSPTSLSARTASPSTCRAPTTTSGTW